MIFWASVVVVNGVVVFVKGIVLSVPVAVVIVSLKVGIPVEEMIEALVAPVPWPPHCEVTIGGWGGSVGAGALTLASMGDQTECI